MAQSDIVWSSEAWLCNRQLMHYVAFSKNGNNISVHSFVRISDNEAKASLGYIEDMFEDRTGEKMVRLCPLLFGKDIDEALVPKQNPLLSREVLMTSPKLKISVKHIDGPAKVLTPGHYKKCSLLNLSTGCFVCHRQFKNNLFKSFDLSKLSGYDVQPIIFIMRNRFHQLINLALESVSMDERVAVKGGTLTRERMKSKPTNKGHAGSELPGNGNVEVLCLDSGLEGCWFRCKILRSLQNRIKVQYCDVTEVNGLEEWVPKERVATPDTLGMRCGGRLTVRPLPDWDSSLMIIEVGAAIDVWYQDGWWEAVVIQCNTKDVRVYLPGECMLMVLGNAPTRISKDWVNNEWVEIRTKRDIMSILY